MKSPRRKVPDEKRSETSRNEVSNSLPVPVELIIDIFSRLPVKSVARCRCVSKSWASILRRPDFTELFFTRSSARPQLLFASGIHSELNFSSTPHVQDLNENSSPIAVNHLRKFPSDGYSESCGFVRGLVCVSLVWFDRIPEKFLVICNPSTGQYLHLPLVKTKKYPFKSFSFFGHDPIEKQYKVLVILADKVGEEHHILTLGTEKLSWRKIDCCMPRCADHEHVCINGLLYYLAQVNSSSVLVCFDFTTEKFKVIKAMELQIFGANLVNYNGKLASLSSTPLSEEFYSYYIYGGSRSFKMHVLEDPEKHEWSKHVYEFPPQWQEVVGEDTLSFSGVIGTNEIVLFEISGSLPFYVIYYNFERKTIRKVEIQGTDAFRRERDHICVDHVEDVQLMEMFRTHK